MTSLPFESKKNLPARLQSALVWLCALPDLWNTDLDAALHLIAKTAGRALNVGRAGIWEYDLSGTLLVCQTQYLLDSDTFVAVPALRKHDFPHYFASLETHRLICANDALNDHRTHEFLEAYLLPHNIKSMMDASLREAGQTRGVLCLEHLGTIRLWSRDEQEFATSLADLIAQVLMFYRMSDSEARHRALFEQARDAVLVLNDTMIVDCNKSAEHLFRRPREQLIGKTPMDVSPEHQPDGQSSADAASEIIRQAFLGIPQFFRWTIARSDGRPLPCEVTIERIRAGRDYLLQVIVRDVDIQTSADDAIRLIAQGLALRDDRLLFEQLVHHLAVNIDATQIMLACINQDTRTYSTLALSHERTLAGNITRPLHGSAFEAVLTGSPLQITRGVREFHPDDDWLQSHGIESLIVRPFFNSQQDVLGFVAMLDRRPLPESTAYDDILDIFALRAAAELERLASQEKLIAAADTDELTGLPNRRKLHAALADAIAASMPDDTHAPALILLDLNRFKDINDTLGHPVGDQLLVSVGARLKSALEDPDILLCRMGGDEFAVMARRIRDVGEARMLAQRVTDALSAPFHVDDTTLSLGGSLGIALYPDHGDDSHALMRCADVAMYHAKSTAHRHAVYDPSQDAYSPRRLRLMTDLGHAIEARELTLHYQPKIDLHNGRCLGCEALVRWTHPTLGVISPAEFIPLAESSDLIHALSFMVTDIALDQLRAWDERQLHLSVAINISARNLLDKDFPDTLATLLTDKGVAPDRLEIEITESALITDPERALAVANRIAALGVRLSIDDFGTGYSSLSYLRKLPITALKIDRSFVQDMDTNEQDAIIVRSTINLAHNLGLKVVAEGVERPRTLETLTQLGCDIAQGYHISKPIPAAQFEDWLWPQMQSWAPNLF